ncbi:MAG: DUF1295 domain-containing protein [Bacilli bacterium]|nr:DUF1295 domain-containing protein [Bacilli bacterium]
MKYKISMIIWLIIIATLGTLGFVFTSQPLSNLQLETLKILGIICGASVLYCFVVGEISRNNSQMDKLWSILPIAYAWVIAGMGGMKPRLIIIAVLVSLWGIRLTYNFAKKGAYSIKFWSGEEDYRWIYLRKQKVLSNKFVWCLFDLLFISLIQNALVLGITLPGLAIMESEVSFGIVDIIATILMVVFLFIEIIADYQQNKFQVKKYEYLNKGMKLNEIPEPYCRGFNIKGLWGVMRHPNYLGEQGFWISLYLFVIGAGVANYGVFNWSMIGSMVLVMIFIGSSRMAESISVKKYSEYKDYQNIVFKYLPFRKYKK